MDMRSRNSNLTPDERQQALEQEHLILDATELICELLEHKGVTRQELAGRLGKTKGHVTQLLSGERNMTLRTLADVAAALDHRFELRTAPLAAPRTYGGRQPATSAIAQAPLRSVKWTGSHYSANDPIAGATNRPFGRSSDFTPPSQLNRATKLRMVPVKEISKDPKPEATRARRHEYDLVA
jgi:transcriptional regulator with XRE-family HTH domain